MAKYSDDLKELVALYQEVQTNKNKLEGKTAYLITNAKYYESQRHAFSHLITALDLEIKGSLDEEQKRKSYREAIHHIENLDVNGYEYVAGVCLTELREKIEEAGFYTNIGGAKTFHSDAVRHFNQGRDFRPVNKQQAIDSFENSINCYKEGLKEIKPVPAIDRRNLKVNITTMILSIIAIIVGIMVAWWK